MMMSAAGGFSGQGSGSGFVEETCFMCVWMKASQTKLLREEEMNLSWKQMLTTFKAEGDLLPGGPVTSDGP